jgi:Flp pilus assembly protein TadD
MNDNRQDGERLLGMALAALEGGRSVEAGEVLGRLLALEPENVHGRYLHAALQAEASMPEEAEAGFRAVLAAAPEFSTVRFQLGQLLWLRGAGAEAAQILMPLCETGDALAAYACALVALTADDRSRAVLELRSGLGLPQANPALASDMQRLCAQLETSAGNIPVAPAMLLSTYGGQVETDAH